MNDMNPSPQQRGPLLDLNEKANALVREAISSRLHQSYSIDRHFTDLFRELNDAVRPNIRPSDKQLSFAARLISGGLMAIVDHPDRMVNTNFEILKLAADVANYLHEAQS
jgi:hypothetical protein